MGDIKSKIKYLLCSNKLTSSMLKIFFGIKKDGISHLYDIIKEEKYNKKYRKPWSIDKKELARQKKLSEKFVRDVLIGVDCKDKPYEKIVSSLMSIASQSVGKGSAVVFNCETLEYRKKIKFYFENEFDMQLYFVEKYNDVCNIIKEKRFGFYGEIQAGDLLHPYTFFCFFRENKNNDKVLLGYFDEWYFEQDVKKAERHNYKSDFSRLSIYSKNYIEDFFLVKADIFVKMNGFCLDKEKARYYDYILRLIEFVYDKSEEQKFSDIQKKVQLERSILHIKEPMYYRCCIDSKRDTDSETIRIENDLLEIKVLKEHFNRCGMDVQINYDDKLQQRHIIYPIKDRDLVSIIIPNKEHKADLKRCIDSIEEKTTYENYEIIVVENGSDSEEIKDYYEKISKKNNIKICKWNEGFNFSAINNFGSKYAKGKYILLLNNDVEIISEKWIEEMLMYAQMPEIGAVGSMLYYPDDTVQHAGVILGIGGVAGHSHKHLKASQKGYNERMLYTQELSAVTAACMMTRKDIYKEVGGLDEKFEVAFNDIDFCMKVKQKGYGVVFTPYSKLYHYESISRGYETTQAKENRFRSETERFLEKWDVELKKGDSYYNPHLTLRYENFELR